MADTRQEILDATAAVLAERGYEGLTTRAIAERVGITHASLHYHFDTKEDVVVAFVEQSVEHSRDRIAEIQAAADGPADRLATLLDWLLTAMGDDSPDVAGVSYAVVMLELHAHAPHNPDLRRVLREQDDLVTAAIRDAVADGVAAGAFDRVDPDAVADLLLCAWDGAAIRTETLDRDAMTPVTDGLVAHVLTDLGVPDLLEDQR